jgi:hypothetical protein
MNKGAPRHATKYHTSWRSMRGELQEDATCKQYLQVRQEGSRKEGQQYRAIEDSKAQPADVHFEEAIKQATKQIAAKSKTKPRKRAVGKRGGDE